MSVATLQRRHVVQMLDAKKDTPGASRSFLKCVRLIIQYAINIGIRQDDPTAGLRVKAAPDWRPSHLERREHCRVPGCLSDWHQAEAGHGASARHRVALRRCRQARARSYPQWHAHHAGDAEDQGAAGHPGQRGNGGGHQRCCSERARHLPHQRAGSQFRPQEVWGMVLRAVQARWAQWCVGSRAAQGASRRLAEAGCTAPEIAAITGHKSLAEVQRYIAEADRARLARNATVKLRAVE